jgi:transketolase
MIETSAHLREDIFEAKESAATRDGFGKGVVEAARTDARIVVLTADLAESTRAEWFQKEFPERFVEMGVAEQNMAAVAAGMAAAGKIPFVTSYAMFNPGRNWEQVRTTIALNEMPVVVCGMHAGVSVGPDGATHQALEDIALMRVLPNMTVISPCDAEEARKATIAAAMSGRPTYLRFGRSATPLMTTPETPFEIGKSLTLWRSPSPKVALLATGSLAYQTLLAARELESAGIGSLVIDVHTIKPFDEAAIVAAARECGAVVTIEEHQVAGGFGSAVAELLARTQPTPMRFVGVHDAFGQSGEPAQLLEEYGMTAHDIVLAARDIVTSRQT